jgi:cation diffusion facilitator family transporter
VKRKKSWSASLTVLIAFAANVLVAAAKTVAALISGSASMTAEAAHSWADTGNQVFLLIAERKAARKRDKAHPMGYGREAYVWSMIAAFGLFTAGAVVSVMHGIQQLITPEPPGDYGIAYLVLTIAFVLEGVSFIQAFRQNRKAARELDRNTLEQVLKGSDPTLRAVFAEDGAALVGLLIAFAGIFLHQVTGSSVPDAVGSILVGILLAVVAVVLIERNRRFLVGQAVTGDIEGSMAASSSTQRSNASRTCISNTSARASSTSWRPWTYREISGNTTSPWPYAALNANLRTTKPWKRPC